MNREALHSDGRNGRTISMQFWELQKQGKGHNGDVFLTQDRKMS